MSRIRIRIAAVGGTINRASLCVAGRHWPARVAALAILPSDLSTRERVNAATECRDLVRAGRRASRAYDLALDPLSPGARHVYLATCRRLAAGVDSVTWDADTRAREYATARGKLALAAACRKPNLP